MLKQKSLDCHFFSKEMPECHLNEIKYSWKSNLYYGLFLQPSFKKVLIGNTRWNYCDYCTFLYTTRHAISCAESHINNFWLNRFISLKKKNDTSNFSAHLWYHEMLLFGSYWFDLPSLYLEILDILTPQ